MGQIIFTKLSQSKADYFKHMIQEIDLTKENLNVNGCFRLIMETIIRPFTELERKPYCRALDEKIERAFLASNVVQVACDCSDNFLQENLLKEYDKKLKQYDNKFNSRFN